MRVALASLAALIALVAGVGSAYSATTIVAIQDDRLTTWPAPTIDERAELIAQTGASWTRVDVLWRDIAPSRPEKPTDPTDPAYRWERLDSGLRAIDNRDVRVLLATYHSPAWSTGGVDDPRLAPDPDDYAAFMVALGKRYSGDFLAGLQPAPGPPLPEITHFEIWNEPNLDFFFRPQWREVDGEWRAASPGLYAQLVKAVYPRLRAIRPDAEVIIGALGPTTTTKAPQPGDAEQFTGTVGIDTFIAALARADTPATAVSQHIYPGAEPGKSGALPSIQGIPRILELWDELEPRPAPLHHRDRAHDGAEPQPCVFRQRGDPGRVSA